MRTLLRVVSYTMLFVLIGCGYLETKPSPIPTPEPFPESAKFVNEWLGDGCPQPCWHGIVPGQTHLSEALNILHSIPEINYVEVIPNKEANGGNVRFDVTGGGRRLVPGNLVYDTDEEEIIESISYFAGDSITVQHVIDALGEPSHFIGNAGIFDDNEYFYEMQLFFIEAGVRLNWMDRISRQNHSLLLEPNQRSYLSVTFFEPNPKDDSSPGYDEVLQPWPGFGLFEVDCSDRTCQLTPIVREE